MSSSPRFPGLRVLVVDDSKTIRKTAQTLLQREGCEVFLAEDGFDCLSKIIDHKPELIFIDIMMPRLDGYHTCALIKSHKTFRDVPIVMLSSKDGLFDRAKGRVMGANHYLTKPFSHDELMTALEATVAPSSQPKA